MYAIVETGGKQYQVEEGRYVDVEGTVVKTDRAKKIIVFKQRPKKGYRRKQGHRQGFARVMINKIRTTASKAKTETAETTEA